MGAIPTFVFDECVGKPLLRVFEEAQQFAKEEERAYLVHVLDYQLGGVWDEDWIPKLQGCNAIVITADGGKSGKAKGEPLPRVCEKYGLTHVILSPGIHTRPSFRKLTSILSVWAALVALGKVVPGSRYAIEPLGEQAGKLLMKKNPANSVSIATVKPDPDTQTTSQPPGAPSGASQ